MKQPEWQRGGICGALSSTSQQLNHEPSEQRERETTDHVDKNVHQHNCISHRSLISWVHPTGKHVSPFG